MKKTYIKPSISVVNLTASPLMVTSITVSNTSADQDALSRDYYFDDEEE